MMQSLCLSTACFENMVIPLLRSSELLSRNVSPWSTLPSLRISPVLYRSISERVVFPASTCASIPIVRRFIKSPIKRFLLILAYQQKIFNRLQRKSPQYFNINSEHLMRIFSNRHILPQKTDRPSCFLNNICGCETGNTLPAIIILRRIIHPKYRELSENQEPVFIRNVCGFSSIILLQTRQNLPKRRANILVKTGSEVDKF